MKKQFNLKNLQIDIWEDWVDWFKGKDQSWYEFTFFEIKYEDEEHMGTKEFSVALVGIHVKFGWMYDPAKFAKAHLTDENDNPADAAPPPNQP